MLKVLSCCLYYILCCCAVMWMSSLGDHINTTSMNNLPTLSAINSILILLAIIVHININGLSLSSTIINS